MTAPQASERDRRGEDEGEGLPDGEEESAADERAAEREPPKDVLDALGAAEDAGREAVRVEAAVRRLVQVVGEEEREEGERGRLEAWA